MWRRRHRQIDRSDRVGCERSRIVCRWTIVEYCRSSKNKGRWRWRLFATTKTKSRAIDTVWTRNDIDYSTHVVQAEIFVALASATRVDRCGCRWCPGRTATIVNDHIRVNTAVVAVFYRNTPCYMAPNYGCIPPYRLRWNTVIYGHNKMVAYHHRRCSLHTFVCIHRLRP